MQVCPSLGVSRLDARKHAKVDMVQTAKVPNIGKNFLKKLQSGDTILNPLKSAHAQVAASECSQARSVS
jgi:hypothetical protein